MDLVGRRRTSGGARILEDKTEKKKEPYSGYGGSGRQT
jgi:hypothetical protein